MWLKVGGLEGDLGAPRGWTKLDYLSVFQASVHRCTTEGNRIVFPFFFFRPVSLPNRQSRLSDLGAAFCVSPELAGHWNAPCYRHNRPAGRADPALTALDTPRTAYTLYDLEYASASCINPLKFAILGVRLGKLQRLYTENGVPGNCDERKRHALPSRLEPANASQSELDHQGTSGRQTQRRKCRAAGTRGAEGLGIVSGKCYIEI